MAVGVEVPAGLHPVARTVRHSVYVKTVLGIRLEPADYCLHQHAIGAQLGERYQPRRVEFCACCCACRLHLGDGDNGFLFIKHRLTASDEQRGSNSACEVEVSSHGCVSLVGGVGGFAVGNGHFRNAQC